MLLGACAEIPKPVASAPDSGQAEIVSIPPAPADTASLIGRGAREVAELLGEPGFKRRDPPAELWQYRSTHCVLDLFLYADKGGAPTVAHAEVRPVPPVGGQTEKREMPSAECMRAVRNASGRG